MEQLPHSLLFTLIILFLTFFLFIRILTKTNKTKTNNKFPPSPWSLPIIGNLHLLNFNKPHHSLLNLSNKYGPLMLLQLGSFPTVVVSSRDIAEKIFTNHEAAFFSSTALSSLQQQSSFTTTQACPSLPTSITGAMPARSPIPSFLAPLVFYLLKDCEKKK